MGQVGFSPTIQWASRQILAWSLLIKKKKGLKTSSRLLKRTLKKVGLDIQNRGMGLEYLQDQLHIAYKYYYSVKSRHPELRGTYLDDLAEAIAIQDNIPKATVIKNIKTREEQTRKARKIRHVRGKLATGSTTMVTIQLPSGEWQDILDKPSIEEAIMKENKSKYQQSFHTPFLRPPLITDFGLNGVGRRSKDALCGTYKTPPNIDKYTKMFLEHLAYPGNICNTNTTIPVIDTASYRSYW